ncbi:MAG TPA: hypothetical protein VMC05_05350 [Xanthobacteraceae bacterium]|nr:hypothetical protein [Xanthobacteraceae bacterium]
MPILLGFILGVLVTIGGAYEYDATSGRAANGLPATADAQAPLVNWNVVATDWHSLRSQVRVQAEAIEQTIKRHTG